MRGSHSKSWIMLLLFLIIGAVLGGVLGEFLSRIDVFAGFVPYFTKPFQLLNLPPMTADLYIMKVVFGLVLEPNLMSILGMLLGLFLYRRL